MSLQQTKICAEVELIPADQRTPAWLSSAAAASKQWACMHEPSFEVSEEDIQKKLKSAPRLAVATAGSEVMAFLAAAPPIPLVRTGLWALYIPGVIVSPLLKGERIVSQLLAKLEIYPDLFILHTQNLIMAKALWSGRAGRFPAADWRHQLTVPLRADLAEMLPRVERSPMFDARTGRVPGEYEKWLYSGPLPINGQHRSFQDLFGTKDAVLCLSFATQRAAKIGLVDSEVVL